MHAVLLVLLGLAAHGDSTVAASASAPREVVAAVCPAEFREALAPWVAYRQTQGYDVHLVSNMGTPEEIRRRIRKAAPAGQLKFVVLVGDVPTGMDGKPVDGLDAAARARCVPAPYVEAKVIARRGGERQIPNDAWYADLDDDGSPDVAIGRLTADTPEELETIVAKILSYERSTDFGSWRRQLNFVAGMGDFGPLIDTTLDTATRYLLTKDIPADYCISMTQANWRAVYCPDPRRMNQTTIDRLNDGAFFWTYIGHAQPCWLRKMRVPGSRYPLLSVKDVPRLAARRGPSIALFLACYVGAIDSRPDCLAEQMLRQKGGPVAVVASSRRALPYAMAVFGTGMIEQVFKRRAATLGEGVLRSKQGLLHEARDNEARRTLDRMASLLIPSASKRAEERAEHVVLFNLIGDPCLRLRRPQPLSLAAAPHRTDRAKLVVEGNSPIAGRAVVELVHPLGQLGFSPPRRTRYPDSPDALAQFELTYQRANDRRISTAELPVRPGAFRTTLPLPVDLKGTYQVRAFVEGKDSCASGFVELRLDKAPEATSPSTKRP